MLNSSLQKSQPIGYGPSGSGPAMPAVPEAFLSDGLTVFDRLSPAHLELKRQIAPQQGKKIAIDWYFGPQSIGKTPEQQEEEERLAASDMAIRKLTEASMGMSDQDFEELKMQYQTLVDQRRESSFAEPALQDPSQGSLIAAALASVFDQRNASSYMAMPYAYGIQKQNEESAKGLAEFGRKLSYEDQVIENLGRQIEDVNRRRVEGLKMGVSKDLAEDKAKEKRIEDQNKVLRDPKSTVDARRDAITRLAAEGVNLPESVARGYLEPTYVQKGLEDKGDREDKKLAGQLKRWENLNSETTAKIDNLAASKGLKVEQTNFIKARTNWFDEDMQSKVSERYARIFALENGVRIDNDRLVIDKQKLGNLTVKQAHDARISEIKALTDILDSESRSVRGQIDFHTKELAALAGLTDEDSVVRARSLRTKLSELDEKLNGEDGINQELSGLQNILSNLPKEPDSNPYQYNEPTLPNRASQFQPIITEAANTYGLDPNVLNALVQAESNFNPRVKSNKGAMGLTQLMPGTARAMGVKDAFDPRQNVLGGARYLAEQLKRFGRLDYALAAYNAGPGAVQKYGGIPPFAETQNYVRKIMAALGQTYKSSGTKAPKTSSAMPKPGVPAPAPSGWKIRK